MDTSRRNEIAYLYVRHILMERSLPLDQNFRRRIGNIATKIDIPFEEMLTFATDLVQEILEQVSTREPPVLSYGEYVDNLVRRRSLK